MKRKIAWILVLVLMVSCFPVALAETVFSPGETHKSTWDFRQTFETMTVSKGPCTLSIHEKIYKEDEAQELWEILKADLKKLSELVKMDVGQFAPFTLYVVPKTNAGVERYGDQMYCTPADMENGAYRQELIGIVLDEEEYWKTYGLSSCLLNEAVDEAQLKKIYEEKEDLDCLSLFISYFTAPFATDEEIALAQQTSAAVTRYILEKYGIDEFLHGDCVGYKQEWLKAIGVQKDYTDPYAARLQDYRFVKNSSYTLSAITEPEHRFYLEPVDDLKTARDVRMFLYDAAAYSQALLDLFREEAPDYYEAVKKRWEGPMNVFCNPGGSSYTGADMGKIKLQLSYAYMGRLTHILFPPAGEIKSAQDLLTYEGFSSYIYNLFPFYTLNKMRYEGILCKYQNTGDAAGEGKTDNADNRKYLARVTEIYLNNAKMPSCMEEMDAKLFGHAEVAAPMRYGEELKNSVWVQSVKKINGYGFTGAQFGDFVDFLIDNSSLTTYLDFCVKQQDFEEAFGMKFEDAVKTWKEKLEKEIK